MNLIPSMDLLDGRVVRLRHGDPRKATWYDWAPEAWLARLVEAGAPRIHLVDLDGAFGTPGTAAPSAFRDLPRRWPGVRFQLGGGLRTRAAVQAVLEAGFDAVVGTLAVERPEALEGLPGDRLIAALDLRDGAVAVRGWQACAPRPVEAICEDLKAVGFRTALVTDVGRDGTLEGPGLAAAARVAAQGFAVQASGGLRSLRDLEEAGRIPGVVGAIAGRALLDGLLDLDDPAVSAALKGGR